MADGSSIEWTDATWQPITGCSIVSPGCTNCYAMKLAGGRLRHHPSRKGLTNDSKAGPVWNGEVRFNEKWLLQPLEWKQPRRIFVCAHGDLFHESVPDEWIDQVFAVMALSPQHTFQVLTKRAGRMRDYFAKLQDTCERDDRLGRLIRAVSVDDDACLKIKWPLANVWLGVSTERQQEADERIPLLLQTPAAVRFISAEPLLGPIDLTNLGDATMSLNAFTGEARHLLGMRDKTAGKLDWIIAGGESGKGARPMHPDWVRSLQDQCKAAGVEFFFKQWGQWKPLDQFAEKVIKGAGVHAVVGRDGRFIVDTDIADPPNRVFTFKMKKSEAGRLLDGIEHNGFPGVSR